MSATSHRVIDISEAKPIIPQGLNLCRTRSLFQRRTLTNVYRFCSIARNRRFIYALAPRKPQPSSHETTLKCIEISTISRKVLQATRINLDSQYSQALF